VKKCLVRDFDDVGRLFYCELPKEHLGDHYREQKRGYRRAYARVNGVGCTFHQLRRVPTGRL
jgi:hypothetical protein